MQHLSTPNEQFENLPDYPFAPNYTIVGESLTMHFVEEGNPNGEVILLLHGEPSWSYLYRKMIPVFAKAGYRVIAPDLIGFGKSDKPIEQSDYTYARHLNWLTEFVQKLDLKGINLFCQDWGGLLGLRMVTEMPERFKRVVAANTILSTGDVSPGEAFLKWQEYSQKVPVLNIGKIINRGTVTELSEKVIAAYDAPFPEDKYKAGARIFPALVPTSPDHPETQNNRAAWKKLGQWDKPFLTLFSDSDPIMKGMEKIFQNIIPGAKKQPHTIVKGAGHFLQEDKGEEIARLMVDFIKSTTVE